MRILIATGIYPPEIGGPAEYAAQLEKVWKGQGHSVAVAVASRFNFLPIGIRHLVFLFKLLPLVYRSSAVFVLDTFSAALPAVLAARLLRRPVIVRTGGDFLWEAYVERTGKLVLFREFYQTIPLDFTPKEKLIFRLIRYVLSHATLVVFSTSWQRDIFCPAYGIPVLKTRIIENYYGTSTVSQEERVGTVFLGATRNLQWKNAALLRRVFARIQKDHPDVVLDLEPSNHADFLERMKKAYAVILVSLGDISPNMILESIRAGKPFIVTCENGLMNRIGELGLCVDPQNEQDIYEKVLQMLSEPIYRDYCERVRSFNFVHTYDEIGKEIMACFAEVGVV